MALLTCQVTVDTTLAFCRPFCLLRQVDEKQLARSKEKVFRKYRLGNFSVACTAIFSVGFLVLLFIP